MNKLSLIIPVYNTEKYLKKCLESIVTQDNGKIEVILVNDGSKDDSDKICKEYCEKYNYITYIKKENGGVSSARNVGIEKASGDYIWFIDSDDYISAGAIETVFKISETGADLIHFRSTVNDSAVDESIEYPKSDFGKVYENYFLSRKITGVPWDKLFKKERIDDGNLRFAEGVNMGEDVIFVTEFLFVAKSVYITHLHLYHYSRNAESLTGTVRPSQAEDLLTISLIFKEKFGEFLSPYVKDLFLVERLISLCRIVSSIFKKENRAEKLISFYNRIFDEKPNKEAKKKALRLQKTTLKGKIKWSLIFYALENSNSSLLTKLL